jgi:hypothetical protein
MSATSLGFLSAVMSALCLVLLAASDSKRLAGRQSALRNLRALATTVAVLPGILFTLTGQWVAFLIWLGTVAVLGWMIAAAFSAWPSKTSSQLDTTLSETKDAGDQR